MKKLKTFQVFLDGEGAGLGGHENETSIFKILQIGQLRACNINYAAGNVRRGSGNGNLCSIS